MEKISVCLTIHNEERGIRRILGYLDAHFRLIDQTIIVSDACADCTDEFVSEWLQSTSLNVQFIQRKERHGRSDAVRVCLAKSKNDLNVFLAGDINPVEGSFENLLSYFRDPAVGAATGHPILINNKRSLADYLSFLIWNSHDAIGKNQTVKGCFFHLNGEMFAIRKSCLNGFENYVGLAEDAMLGFLIRKNGFKVLWVENVIYEMKYPSSLAEYIKVRKRCCYGRIDLWLHCDLQEYPFYEVSHPEYMLNVLRASDKSLKGVLALIFGASSEILIRIFYRFTVHRKRDLLGELWKPAEGTKW